MNQWIDEINKAKRDVSLDPQKKALIRGNLAVFVHTHPPIARGIFARAMGRFLSPLPLVASFLVFALTSTGVTYASENALPDEPLYAVKQFAETVRGALAITPEAKAEWEEMKAERRLDELTRFVAKKNIAVAAPAPSDSRMEKSAAPAFSASQMAPSVAPIAATLSAPASDTEKDPIVQKLEEQFRSHTKEAQKHISLLEKAGNTSAASALAAKLESTLRLQKKVARAIGATEDDAVASLEIIDEVKVVRTRLEARAAETTSGIREVIDRRLKSVEGEIESLESDPAFVARVGTSTTGEKARSAKASLLEAREAAKSESFKKALLRAQGAEENAKEAKLFFRAGALRERLENAAQEEEMAQDSREADSDAEEDKARE